MGLRIHVHGARTALSRHGLDDRVLVRRILVHDGDRTLAIRRERKLRPGIETGGVYSRSDSRTRDYLAGPHVDDRHGLVAAASEQPLVHAIDRQSARLRARREWPARLDHERLRIKYRDLALVLDVYVHLAAVADSGLRFAAEVDGAEDGSIRGVDRRRVGGA